MQLMKEQVMSDNAENNNAAKLKMAWAIYTVLVVVVIIILFFLVAQDNEERLFYSLMTAAAAYVFRPTKKFMNKMIGAGDTPDQGADS